MLDRGSKDRRSDAPRAQEAGVPIPPATRAQEAGVPIPPATDLQSHITHHREGQEQQPRAGKRLAGHPPTNRKPGQGVARHHQRHQQPGATAAGEGREGREGREGKARKTKVDARRQSVEAVKGSGNKYDHIIHWVYAPKPQPPKTSLQIPTGFRAVPKQKVCASERPWPSAPARGRWSTG